MESSSNYESPRSSRRISQPYNDEVTNDYDYNISKRYEQRSGGGGGGGDEGWGSATSYAKDLEWNDERKNSDKSYSSRGGGSGGGGQKWTSYEGNSRDRGAPYSKGGGTADRYDDNRASYSNDRGDKYYGSAGGGSSGNRSHRDSKQYYERDYPDSYESGDRYNYPPVAADSNKRAAYTDGQDWGRNDKYDTNNNNKTYPKHDSRSQYPESDNSRRHEYSSSSRGHSDRSYPPENDYEQYYNSKSRHEESSYSRVDDWDRKTSYPRGGNDLKRSAATYDEYKNLNVRASGGRGPKYPPPNRGYKGSVTTTPPKSNDNKRLKTYDGRQSFSRYDEGSKDYDRQAVGNESSSEFAEEPLWEEDKYGIKSHAPSKTEPEDPNDPWGKPASSSDPNHWDNFWDNSWGPMPNWVTFMITRKFNDIFQLIDLSLKHNNNTNKFISFFFDDEQKFKIVSSLSSSTAPKTTATVRNKAQSKGRKITKISSATATTNVRKRKGRQPSETSNDLNNGGKSEANSMDVDENNVKTEKSTNVAQEANDSSEHQAESSAHDHSSPIENQESSTARSNKSLEHEKLEKKLLRLRRRLQRLVLKDEGIEPQDVEKVNEIFEEIEKFPVSVPMLRGTKV
ncbi:13759_t:CDS:2, partial [Entrophospora sp. SA101]